MDRRRFLLKGATAGVTAAASPLLAARSDIASSKQDAQLEMTEIEQGVWRLRFGQPERVTPINNRSTAVHKSGLARLPQVKICPVSADASISSRGVMLNLPIAAGEAIYGLGLQMKSVQQRGSKKLLRVNADPRVDSGDAHAPVPFYVTTRGYGVLVDTARYATFYCGNTSPQNQPHEATAPANASVPIDGLPAAYKKLQMDHAAEMQIEIPRAAGVDVYIFAGPSMLEAVQRYNVFSGGGALPPRWGLGVWYRAKGDFNQQQVLNLAQEMRSHKIPCDVIGLEPGWQSHSYSCSYLWSDAFPDPSAMVKELKRSQYHVNLWEHAFVHPTSPLHASLQSHSGDYRVWDGLVPDFLDQHARSIFADFHEKEHIALGVEGYKLDECDNSDFTGGWSFPETCHFSSGADGEQMHSLFGLAYQRTIQSAFERRGQRTYGLVRSSGALAAPSPYVLYSDLYDHRDFIRALVTSSFSGLLWTPEVRGVTSAEDLLRRLQSVVLSPTALINAWNISAPPWQTANLTLSAKDNTLVDAAEIEASCRTVLELRMRLLPYIHAAFVTYSFEGIPPFRAMVLDSPDDPNTWLIDDQYMVGEGLLVAPMFAGEEGRNVYLPRGEWFDFWTGMRHTGSSTIKVELPVAQIPIFVRAGTLLPLAQPTLSVQDQQSWLIEARIYGKASAACKLYADPEGLSTLPACIELKWDSDTKSGHVSSSEATRYKVSSWNVIGE